MIPAFKPQRGWTGSLLLVVAGEEDLTVLVEVVNKTFDGVGGGSHAATE
jgi:hypothetical protein